MIVTDNRFFNHEIVDFAVLFPLSFCFVYFMQWRPLLLETASAGFSPINGQPPRNGRVGRLLVKIYRKHPNSLHNIALVTFYVCIAQLTGLFHWICQQYLNKLF
jgi:hypothetical protein